MDTDKDIQDIYNIIYIYILYNGCDIISIIYIYIIYDINSMIYNVFIYIYAYFCNKVIDIVMISVYGLEACQHPTPL